jgi:hypothetical protein
MADKKWDLEFGHFRINIPPPVPARAEDARIPDSIPNIYECDYLSQPFANRCGEFTEKSDGHVLTDDELFAQVVDVWNRQLAWSVFVPVPLTHMVYAQVVGVLCEEFTDRAYVEPDRETARVVVDGVPWFVRVAWLHSPAPDGEAWGSNNWTPEQGAKTAKFRRDFDELNKDNPNWPGW